MALNLRNIAAVGARIGLQLAGNTKVSITLKLGYQGGVYNPTTDATTASGTDVATQALRYQDRRQLKPDNVVQDAQQQAYSHSYLVEGVNIPTGQEVKPGDVVVEDAARWVVMQVRPDPAGATVIVDVRR